MRFAGLTHNPEVTMASLGAVKEWRVKGPFPNQEEAYKWLGLLLNKSGFRLHPEPPAGYYGFTYER